MKYAKEFEIPTILFYDYDTLLALEVPEALHAKESGLLMEATIWREAKKSTEADPSYSDNNHVAVLLYYIVQAVTRVEKVRLELD